MCSARATAHCRLCSDATAAVVMVLVLLVLLLLMPVLLLALVLLLLVLVLVLVVVSTRPPALSRSSLTRWHRSAARAAASLTPTPLP